MLYLSFWGRFEAGQLPISGHRSAVSTNLNDSLHSDSIYLLVCNIMCVQQKVNQFHTNLLERRYSVYLGSPSLRVFTKSDHLRDTRQQRKKNSGLVLYLFLSPNTFTVIFLLSPCPITLPSPPFDLMEWHLGGALPGSRRGPARLGLGLVGVSCLRGGRVKRVPSLASLLEVALVPGGLREHLHPALLVLLQASPELGTLPFSLQLPGEAAEKGK